jgi:hypothetical protein
MVRPCKCGGIDESAQCTQRKLLNETRKPSIDKTRSAQGAERADIKIIFAVILNHSSKNKTTQTFLPIFVYLPIAVLPPNDEIKSLLTRAIVDSRICGGRFYTHDHIADNGRGLVQKP